MLMVLLMPFDLFLSQQMHSVSGEIDFQLKSISITSARMIGKRSPPTGTEHRVVMSLQVDGGRGGCAANKYKSIVAEL